MKKTANMIYRPSAESRELYLVADNESKLYPMKCAIESNLIKKLEKGVYDAEKATIAFFHLTTEASRQYMKDFGYAFNVTERWTAAQDMRDDFISEYNINGRAAI